MAGDKYYELSNHLGNVLAVISDKKIPQFNTDDVPSSGLKVFNPEVLSYSDYDPFGMLVPNRHGASIPNGYRYGFNGMELDNELKGEGKSIDFGARIYDPRVGRWFAIDPLAEQTPNWSPYAFCNNNPIRFIDPTGMSTEDPIDPPKPGQGTSTGNMQGHLPNGAPNGVDLPVQQLNEVVVQGPKKSSTSNLDNLLNTASDSWNTPLARLLVPDKISLSLSTSVTAFVGVSEELSFNWITRGNDGSVVPYVMATTGGQAGLGVSGDALVGGSVGYFATKDMRSLKPGVAANGLLGWSAYGSMDGGAVLGGSITGSVGFSNKPFTSRPTWISGGISGGASIGAAGTGGISYSFPVFQSQFKK